MGSRWYRDTAPGARPKIFLRADMLECGPAAGFGLCAPRGGGVRQRGGEHAWPACLAKGLMVRSRARSR